MDKIDPRAGWFQLKPQSDETKTKKKETSAPLKSFGRVLDNEKSRQAQELQPDLQAGEVEDAQISKLLDEVHEAGTELTKMPSPENIHQYKRKIAQFMKLIVAQSFEVDEKYAWRKRDGAKVKHVLVQRINEKLDKLGAFVLQNQKDKLEILRKTDELYGLLVDLRS